MKFYHRETILIKIYRKFFEFSRYVREPPQFQIFMAIDKYRAVFIRTIDYRHLQSLTNVIRRQKQTEY